MVKYHLKSEFRSRLVCVHRFIGELLEKDSNEGFSSPVWNAWPSLFGLYSYLWSRNVGDCFKKVYKKDGDKDL